MKPIGLLNVFSHIRLRRCCRLLPLKNKTEPSARNEVEGG